MWYATMPLRRVRSMPEARVGNCPNPLPAVGDQKVEFSRPLKRCLCLAALLVHGDTRSHFPIAVKPEHQLSNCELSPPRQGFIMYCVMWKGEEGVWKKII